jgi:DMSO/TMAO reductase YedYZ molybdopterin-dependent catalytic subunit
MVHFFVYNANGHCPSSNRFAFVGSHPFFQQHIRAVPAVSAAHWSFSIGGSVRHPLILTLDDLQGFPSVEWTCAVACASPNPLLGQANWRGVPLATLLAELNIDPEAQHARIYSADGYSSSLTLERLCAALLVYEMDGQPLTPDHGFPARLIAPGLYGYKMPKWVTHIRLSDVQTPGFWESRGWPEAGMVQPLASIRDAQPAPNGGLIISGVAYGGEQGVARVEVSLDDGDWTPAILTRGGDHEWSSWQVGWTSDYTGDVLCRVRAIDTDGNIQPNPHAAILRILQERA